MTTARLAAPAIVLAGILLLPFLDRPFTIDDPLFMREAAHALVDPLHPADFEQVWNTGDRQKFSQFLLGGTLPAYVMAPVAAAGGREWMAHLYQFGLLCGFLIAAAGVARRLGCDDRQATVAALLVGSNPVTLAMSATCMPDIMAAMFATMGIDRVLSFRENRHPGAGAAGGALLAAAVLCRATTAPLVLAAALLLKPFHLKRLWPLAVIAILVVVFLGLNRSSAFQDLTGLRNIPRNTVAFLCFQALTGPLLAYRLLVRGRWFAALVVALVAAAMALSALEISSNLSHYAVPAALGICFAIALAGLLRELGHPLPLLGCLMVWLLSGMVALPYVHMAAKYLLPGVPAAAVLIVLHAARMPQRRYPSIIALLIALGWISGALIIVGDTALASSQRDAVQRLIAPRIRQGGTVWAAGQWAFLGYAQQAGAQPLANSPPLPKPGDTIVVSRLDYYGNLDQLLPRRDFLNSQIDRRCGVFVMNRPLAAGFYSVRFGYLPFAIGCGELNRYDEYRVLP
jgi:hypothetical protein